MAEKNTKYIEKIGRRKTSTARVRLTPASKSSILVNDKELNEYFPTSALRSIVMDPIASNQITDKFEITVVVSGGGIHSQAEAIRHGLARILASTEPDLKNKMKSAGFLKRDPRAKERRKFGLKKARKAPQWSKR